MTIIRELDANDTDAFRNLRLIGLKECPTAFGASYEDEAKLERVDFERRLIGKGDRWTLGAFVDDSLVGSVGFRREESEKLHHMGHIWGMYVDVPWRGRGIGRKLLEATLERVDRLEGLRKIRLGVTESNIEAQRLYESAGFVRFCVENEYLFVDGKYFSMLLMSRPTLRLSKHFPQPAIRSAD